LDSATLYRWHPAAAVFNGISQRQDAADTTQGIQFPEVSLPNS